MSEFNLFLQLGWDHILEGYDHLLFLLALVLFVSDLKKIVWIVSAFTLTHTISMVLVTLGWVKAPAHWVEVFIALSIVYSAIENVIAKETDRKWMIAGLFGFIHGAGFSSHLSGILSGMDSVGSISASILGFFVGLEAGQLLAVSIVLALMYVIREKSWSIPLKTELSRAVAAVGLFLIISRVFEL